ncbi:MAG: Lipid III flippase [Candidatus Erwinia impunctatus]|nr:Lipid III flippase [Culicoides impunctatus]
MSLVRASVWTALSMLIKLISGLMVVKLFALSFGPEGIGQAGNFRQMITVLGVLAGAGIFNGVIKAVAGTEQNPQALRKVTGTASTLVLLCSLLLAVIFLLFASQIATLLFGDDRFKNVIRGVAVFQCAIAWANLSLSVIKGFRDARGSALVVTVSSVLGVVIWYLLFSLWGYAGALAGLAAIPAVVLLPASYYLLRHPVITWRVFLPCWDGVIARHLSKFILMTLLTAVTLPVAWVMMRNQLAASHGWHQVGLWQGVTTLSDAYLQLITATFTVWLLPTLAKLNDRRQIAIEILRTLSFILPVMLLVSGVLWLCRDWVILLLFSAEFTPMRDLFIWQLTGDIFKIGAYVFGYLIIAHASLRFYLLTELTQFLLLVLFSRWLIPQGGTVGAAQAYMYAYLLYFMLCCGCFYLYCRKIPSC